MLEAPLLKAHAGRAQTLVVAADVLLVGLVFYLVLSFPGVYQPADGTDEIGALRLAFVSLVASLQSTGYPRNQPRKPARGSAGRG